jgi:glutamate formiminotransferase/formiminotetrahydrofolate cyclodeaminase
MNTIVECVPNFSEGRNRPVIDQIIEAILSVPGICLMDLEMDPDHNRSVVTFVGEKEKVGEGALRAMGKAAELIDLNLHKGNHPRIGATDVVPFIPVRNTTLEECVMIARQVGEAAAERYGIPIYLYEAAATRPERVQLENLRKGQFEGLRQDIETSPARLPDFGQPRLHPTAGATVVGARKFLIAYNLNLNTSEVAIAKNIAKTIRYSSGGLKNVKAMGVDLKSRGVAQVSMNLTDYEQTPIHRVFEMVKREAERYGTSILGSEIVGLVPQKALDLAADFYLQIENFRPELVFENRLQSILNEKRSLQDLTIRQFLEAVAGTDSVPGGGSVAALAGALAATLGKMVVSFSLAKKGLEEYQPQLNEQLEKLTIAHRDLQSAIQKDSEAYLGVEAALKMPKASEEEKKLRQRQMQRTLQTAALIPMEVAEKSADLMRNFQALESISNPNLKSDLKTGFWMAHAATRGALENVAINLKSIKDQTLITQLQKRVHEVKNILEDSLKII